MTTGKVKIGIVGCGEHSNENLIPALWSNPLAEVVAICDIDTACAERAASRFRTALTYPNFESLLNEARIEAIIAAAPPQIHSQVASRALALGIHVFVEKPPTVTTGELSALAEAAKRSGLVTMVGHNLRHTTAATAMKSFTSDLAFGIPSSMEVRYYASKPRGDRWGLNSPLRSFLLSHVNHAIDLMVYQVGYPLGVKSSATCSQNGGITLAANVEFKGAIGTLFATTSSPHFSVQATVFGSNDTFVAMDSLHQVVEYGLKENAKRQGRNWIERQLDSGFTHAGYQKELDLFLNAVLGTAVCSPSFEDEVPVYQMLDRIEEQVGSRLIKSLNVP